MPTTLVIGASTDPRRYAYMAINKLLAHGFEVKAISNKVGAVHDVQFQKPFPELTNIDTVTLYINAEIQKSYYDYILQLHPKRVIFNPGTENNEFETLLQNKGITTLEACTLVMLSLGTY